MSLKPHARSLVLGAAALGLTAAAGIAGERWPDLPVGVKSGVSARVGDTVYVGLGSAGADFYSLDLADPSQGWVKRADFIGPATNGAAAAASNGTIYVFSGNGKPTADAAAPIIFDTVYAYDTAADAWSPVDTKTPVGLSGAKALALADGRIAIVGGYNKELFDKYLADVAAIDKDKDPEGFAKLVAGYMGMLPRAYRWNAEVLAYDPAANAWGKLGDNPFLPNCDSAIAPQGENAFLVVSGEIKPGLRTPNVKSVKIDGAAASWKQLPDLPAPAADTPQEGVAGAYAGTVGDTVLVAGGANFPGARANGEAGKWFAHEGLTKTWRDEIYAFDGRDWKTVGALPRGLAYGASFSTPAGVLVVGGEDGEGQPRTEVFALKWDGAAVSVED
jgi:N-acetylneuraminate epimerase